MIENIATFKIGIIGGGQRCKALLTAIFSETDAQKRPDILGVADSHSGAMGLQYAQSKGIFVTADYRDLFAIEGLELLLELTPDDSLKQQILAEKPPGVMLVDHHEALALLDHFRIKAKKIELLEKLQAGQGERQKSVELIEEFYHFVQDINNAANAYGRQTRQSLISSEQILSQIINNTSIPTFVIDKNHKVTHWNRACEILTGYSSRKMVGSDDQWRPFRLQKRPTMADLVLDGVSQETLWRLYGTRWEKSTLMEGAFEAEEFFPHLGPSGTWLFFTAALIKSPDGTIVAVIETLWDRTQRRQAEQALKDKAKELVAKVDQLRANEQTMAQIINGSTIPTFVIDKSHKVTHWNKALERLSGTPADQVIGTTKSWAPFYDRERPSMADVILDQADEAQIEKLYGTKWRKSVLIDGAYEADAFFSHLGQGGKWCWFTAAPIKTTQGEVVGAIETIWDKTEDHLAEQEREQHTKELAAYCSIYATLSSPLSLEGRIKAAIAEVASIFLLDGVCIFIRRPDGQFHLQYSYGFSDNVCFFNRVADPQSMVMQVAQEGQIQVIQDLAKGRSKGLDVLHAEGLRSLVYIPILDKEKHSFGVIRAASRSAQHFGPDELRALELFANRIGVAIENFLLEQDVKRRTSFQAKLIGSSNDGIVATDDQGKVVIFNPAAESIFGHAGDEVVHQQHYRQICPALIVDHFERAMASDDPRHWSLPWQETLVVSKEGQEIPVRFSGTVLRQKHQKLGFVAFFQDLRQIKRLEKELLGAERLAAVGQTVAGMAHCVKNILHGLKGGSYMVNIGIDKDNPEKLKTGWNMVQRNIGRTAELVQDLLSYSKEREPEMAPCRPNAIVAEVIELIQDQAKENTVALETNLSPEIGEVLLDQRSLHRSLLNLASNAIDACREDPNLDKKHTLTITTALEADQWVRFDVHDNGSGMSEEVMAKLFTSFFSTKGSLGTGLGLLVTSKLIEEHNGTIAVDSQLDQGTTFTIRLPLIVDQ
jgi:PAS domain S-box-containing protein